VLPDVFNSQCPCHSSRESKGAFFGRVICFFIYSRHQTWNWVIGSPGQWVIWVIFHVPSPGHHFDPVWNPSFSGFRKNAQNAKRTFEMLKWQKSLSGICCWTDINHCMSVHAMNFYFYLWLLKILWPENTSSHISRHLEFTIEQGHRVNWVSGSLDSRVTGSQNVTQFHLCTSRSIVNTIGPWLR